jgi:hypothetical protein
MQTFLVHEGGKIEEIPDPKGSLKAFYGHLGANLVQMVSFPWGELWVDEEGKLTGRDFNPVATKIWAGSYGRTDTIVGPAILRVRKGAKLPFPKSLVK